MGMTRTTTSDRQEQREITIFVPRDVDEQWFLGEVYSAVGSILLRGSGKAGVLPEGAVDRRVVARTNAHAWSDYSGDALEAQVRRFVDDVTIDARRLLRAIAEVAA